MPAPPPELPRGVRRHEPSGPWAYTPLTETESRACLQRARDFGFARAGIANVSLPFAEAHRRLRAFLEAERHGEMSYLDDRDSEPSGERGRVASVHPTARTALVVALPYPEQGDHTSPDVELRGRVARYAQGEDYHLILKRKLHHLADEVARVCERPVLARACVDTAPLFERDLATRAGFAFLGKNTLAIAPGAGSLFLIGELLVDLELPSIGPPLPEGCGQCSLCIDACPTDALEKPFTMDANRCISYLTIETAQDIPPALRSRMKNWVFGCDECQDICPYNRSAGDRHRMDGHVAHAALRNVDLGSWLSIGSAAYKRLVKNTALARASRNQLARNAAVALGNSEDPRAVPSLVAALRHVSPSVRRHALWALRQLALHGVADASEALAQVTPNLEADLQRELDALEADSKLESERSVDRGTKSS